MRKSDLLIDFNDFKEIAFCGTPPIGVSYTCAKVMNPIVMDEGI